MNIAVIGEGSGDDKAIIEKAKAIGRAIAKHNAILYTGGCRGYPYAAAEGANELKGKTIAISPAKDEEEHKTKYNFPLIFSKIKYTGLGIPGRNYQLIKEIDAAIMINGKIGTLNEFTLAFHLRKPVGVLKGSGGISEMIGTIADVCDRDGRKENIVYSENPEELVKKIIKLLK